MEKICAKSGKKFVINESDETFYTKLDLPLPSLSPKERQRRRLAWRNESKLYWRKCDGTGERILSVFAPEKPYTVYDYDYWISDKWEPLDYGRDFDFDRPFFEQFDELLRDVPQVARSAFGNTNSPYVNQAGQNQDAYMLFEADYTKDCAYCWHITDSKHCIDCDYLERCQNCYDCVSCVDCQSGFYLQNCRDCQNSYFLKNCEGCKNCFGCINLKDKEFYFRNESLSEDEYYARLKALNLETASGLTQARQELETWFESFPHPHCNGFNFKDSTGDYLYNTENCLDGYFLVDCQNTRYVNEARNVSNTYDMDTFGSRHGAHDCYEVHEVGGNTGPVKNIFFSEQVWDDCERLYYCKLCLDSCQDLFGCIGLRGKKHCIFNKQYSPEEYEVLKNKILEHMKQTGEWGEYFPANISPFGYNETVAQEVMPLLKSEAKNKEFKWFESNDKDVYQGPTQVAPDSIRDADLTICDQILNCLETGENYRVLQSEYNFYKQHQIPIPSLCPLERHRLREDLRNPRRLHDRHCQECHTHLASTYGPERSETVLCQDCYNRALI